MHWPLPAPVGFSYTPNYIYDGAWSVPWPPTSLRRTIFITVLEVCHGLYVSTPNLACHGLCAWSGSVLWQCAPCCREGDVAPFDLHYLLVRTRTYVDDVAASRRCCAGWGHGSKAQKQTLLSELRTAQPWPNKNESVSIHFKIGEKLMENHQRKILTTKAVLMLYPNAFTTIVMTILFTIITSITAASNMSTWFHKNLTCMSIPILARKSAANRLRMASTLK